MRAPDFPLRSACSLAIAASLLCGLPLSLVAQPSPAPPTAASSAGEPPISLSVFEVTTSRDIGYLSTNAAEVTRMDTPIENIPMNVSIS